MAEQLRLVDDVRIPPLERDIAYAAGFFDGEGCVSLCRMKNGAVKAQVMVANGNDAVLRRLQAIWGGSVYHNRRRAGKPYWNRMYVWNLTSTAATFLTDIRPHLEIKGPVADNALAFLARPRIGGRGESDPTLVAAFLATHKRLQGRARAPESDYLDT